MIRRADSTVLADGVTPEPGVFITVKDSLGDLASLFDDSFIPMPNPFQSGSGGVFVYNVEAEGPYVEEYRLSLSDTPRKVISLFMGNEGPQGPKGDIGLTGPMGDVAKVADRNALAAIIGQAAGATRFLTENRREGSFVWSNTNNSANVTADAAQGIFVPPASDTTGASGAWVRKFPGDINASWFGFVPNDSSSPARLANSNAMLALLAFLRATGTTSTAYLMTQRALFGPGTFYFDGTHGDYFDVKCAIDFLGAGSVASVPDGPVTEFVFPTGGFRMNRSNTLNGALESPATTGADGWRIRGIRMTSEQARPGGYPTGATTGILSYCRGDLRDCMVDRFTLDNVALVSGSVSGVTDANCNNSLVQDNQINFAGRHGLYMTGIDSNASKISGNLFHGNNNWGLYANGFLASSYRDNRFEFNGLASFSPKGDAISAMCFFGSSRYYINPPNLASASTTTPGTNNAIWVLETETAGASSANANIPTWVSGMTWKDGGSFYCSNNNTPTLNDAYVELGEPQPFFSIRGIARGGTLEGNPNSLGLFEVSTGLGKEISGNVAIYYRNAQVIWKTTAAPTITPPDGAAGNPAFNIYHSNSSATINFGRVTTAGAFVSNDQSIVGQHGFGLRYYVVDPAEFHEFFVNGNSVAYVDSVSIGLRSGSVLRYNGTNIISGGVLTAAGSPAYTGDVTKAAGSLATSLAAATVVSKIAGQAIAPASVAATGNVTSSGGGVGYATGAGGTVTQATSKSTGVTLNKLCGQITMNAAALAANTGVAFTVTNSQIAATDTIDLVLASGNATAGTYNYQVDKVSAGSFVIWVKNISAGSLSEGLVFNFSVKKAVNA